MSITVAELTDITYLGTRIEAGASGANRRIGWAHSIEVPRPWEWLGAGDLLMTTGMNVPAEPEAQVEFLRHLVAGGLAGVAIGENMNSPPLTPLMREAADRHALPILTTAYEIPFVDLARAVAAANQHSEQRRLAKAARIYDIARAASEAGDNGARLFTRLEQELDCRLFVGEPTDLRAALAGLGPLDESLTTALKEAIRSHGTPLPGLLRVEYDGTPALLAPVPSRRPSVLVILPRGDERPGTAVVQHVATLTALEVERESTARAERRRRGAELLVELLESRIDTRSAGVALESHGLRPARLVVMAVRTRGQAPVDLPEVLCAHASGHLVCAMGKDWLALLPHDDASLDRLVARIGDRFAIGISERVGSLGGVPDAAREARWALEVAMTDGLQRVRYGEGVAVFGPRSVSEARRTVERVLGPLLAYDEEHGTDLARSLAVFLANNRSWTRSTRELAVHKQTLVYRMRRVEELTARRLNDTGDVAELWLTLRAVEMLGDRTVV